MKRGVLEFRSRPLAWRYMLGALHATRGLQPGQSLPEVSASWRGYRIPRRDVEAFVRLCGLEPVSGRLPPLLVHAVAFRLQMAVLTHRRVPVPIWRVLQVRNRLVDLADIAEDAPLDIDCRVQAQRVVAKGLELDLHTTIRAAGQLAAESVNTFYVRGRFAGALSDVPEPPAAGEDTVAAWTMPAEEGWRFGALTGDYNGIHLWNPYARLFGFRRAFFHPLRVVAQSLARAGLQGMPVPRRVEAWLRGPVFHGSEVSLRRRDEAGATVLAVLAGEDPRPAIVLRVAPAG